MAKTGENSVVNDAVDVLLRDISEEGDDDEQGETKEKQSLPLDYMSGNIIEMMIPGEETVPMAMTLAVKFLGDSPVALHQLMVRTIQIPNIKL